MDLIYEHYTRDDPPFARLQTLYARLASVDSIDALRAELVRCMAYRYHENIAFLLLYTKRTNLFSTRDLIHTPMPHLNNATVRELAWVHHAIPYETHFLLALLGDDPDSADINAFTAVPGDGHLGQSADRPLLRNCYDLQTADTPHLTARTYADTHGLKLCQAWFNSNSE
jgi:hypothetical protein